MRKTSDAPEIIDLTKPKYTRPEVAAIIKLTDGQLKGILDRKVVELSNHNPGTGNPRLFSQSDIIKIAVGAAMARIGVPMRQLQPLAEFVYGRARHLADTLGLKALTTEDSALTKAMLVDWLALFPLNDPGDRWGAIEINAEHPFEPSGMPTSYSVLQVDLIIQETFRRIGAFETGRPWPRSVLSQIKEQL